MRPSWRRSVRRALSWLPLSPQTDAGPGIARPPRIVLVGIGQELRGDDAAGPRVAQGLRQRIRRQTIPASDPAAVLVIEGGPAPENCTGPIRRFAPDLVILVDAAQMDEAPGTIRWLDWQDLAGLSASTHTLPPSILAHYLTVELRCRVALVGIQPQQTDVGAPLSEAVQAAVDAVVTELSGAFWGTPPRARAHEGIDSRTTVP